MGVDDDGVLEAARAIRPYLPRLLGDPGAVEKLDQALAETLTGTTAAGTTTGQTATAVRALLDAHANTAWFLTAVLADAPAYRPPYQQPRYLHRQTGGASYRGMTAPAGDPGPVAADRYACPHGDYVWYRPDIGTPIAACPTHHVPLVRT
ncbi:hypothetical protein [Protofrankia symbiont of Coriaria ruscifolia]|uniref:hypothetical protein n=1 Tax=Protofrankia symbiont of Coriaria ruscifolia TaxID=1306542 RepID=UPI0010411CDF|nr:hypothetical protein [Protofrankia symbiont of Coriaria ruscifolia]